MRYDIAGIIWRASERPWDGAILSHSPHQPLPYPFGRYGADGGGMRRFVACSNAYASSISRGSLQANPVKPTPNGAGFAAKVSGNGGAGASGAFGTRPNGTMTVG